MELEIECPWQQGLSKARVKGNVLRVVLGTKHVLKVCPHIILPLVSLRFSLKLSLLRAARKPSGMSATSAKQKQSHQRVVLVKLS